MSRRLDVPDVGPIAVARLALDLDLDARLLGARLVEDSGIDRAGESDVRGAQQHRTAVAGFLVVECRLVRIVGALLDTFGEERIGVVDREVVADLAVAAKDALDQSLASIAYFSAMRRSLLSNGAVLQCMMKT